METVPAYRRDFQGGIVLVNPSAEARTVMLERVYRVLRSTAYFTVAGGTLLQRVTITSLDAVILLSE